MKPFTALLRALLVAAFALPGAAPAAPASPVGVWKNTRDTVRIRIAPCGGGLCGTVVSASPEAKADAARGGTAKLVGSQLFRGFRRGDDGKWHGTVHIPDLDRDVEGTLEFSDPATLAATGCLFAGIGCQTRHWTRVR